VDAHADLVQSYIAAAEGAGEIVAVFETHVQADHVSGLPALVAETGATAYLPAGAGADFPHHPLEDGEVVELGNTVVTAMSTPGHAPAHHAFVVADRRRDTDEPWLVFTGDSLLVNDVGRPDLHAGGADPRPLALEQHASIARLMTLADSVIVLPSHYGGSVCGRGLSGNPVSSIGFERRHNRALEHTEAGDFAEALLANPPPAPPDQAGIVAANRAGAAVSS
jgi:glyoxylase-like metal-dependent hydrolase (beta-lactamase superfamily II)